MISIRKSLPPLALATCLIQLLSMTFSGAVNSEWQAPLSDSEITIALSGIEQSTTSNGDKTQAAANITSAFVTSRTQTVELNQSSLQNQQVLLIELRELKSRSGQEPHRVAEVFVYRYDQAETFKHLIDVSSGQLIETKPVASVHLPLNEAEQEFALQRLLKSPLVASRLATEFERQFGKNLPPMHELQTKVSIWQPSRTNSEVANTCQLQRCALVSIFTANNYNFSVEPVINLHTGVVETGVLQ